jgi:hypothetical protein
VCYGEIDTTSGELSYKYDNRIIVEAIYLMLNMDDFGVLHHALRLDSKLKSNFILRQSIKVSISYQQRNFHRVFKYILELPHLIGAIASLKLSEMRKEMFHIFSIAYNSQSLKVPCEFLQRLLIYDTTEALLLHLRDLGIHNEEEKSPEAINFNRKKFHNKIIVSYFSFHIILFFSYGLCAEIFSFFYLS